MHAFCIPIGVTRMLKGREPLTDRLFVCLLTCYFLNYLHPSIVLSLDIPLGIMWMPEPTPATVVQRRGIPWTGCQSVVFICMHWIGSCYCFYFLFCFFTEESWESLPFFKISLQWLFEEVQQLRVPGRMWLTDQKKHSSSIIHCSSRSLTFLKRRH